MGFFGLPFVFVNPKQSGWFAGILIVLVMLYYKKDRRESILEKYSHYFYRQFKKPATGFYSVYMNPDKFSFAQIS